MCQCNVGELILENLAKGQCCVFAPYGRLIYPFSHGRGSLASTVFWKIHARHMPVRTVTSRGRSTSRGWPHLARRGAEPGRPI